VSLHPHKAKREDTVRNEKSPTVVKSVAMKKFWLRLLVKKHNNASLILKVRLSKKRCTTILLLLTG
jgi:hypothetical protein